MIAPANSHDAIYLEDVLNAIVVERPGTQQHLCLDKGYDHATGRETADEFGYRPHIRSIRDESRKRRPGQHKARRWVVKPTLG